MIALDARMVRHSGIGSYLRGLLSGFSKEELDRIVLMGPPEALPPAAGVLPASEPIYGWREQWAMPRRLRKIAPSLLHVPHFNIPLAYPGPLVVTIHDVIHLLFPQFSRARFAAVYARFMLSRVAARTALVMADSECTKRDLVRFGFSDKKIRVVPLAVDGRFRPVDPAEAAKRVGRYGLTPGYLLYVGNLRPIKNIPRLVEAYALLRRRRPDVPPLVLAGRDQMSRESAAWRSDPSIKFPGEIASEDLPALYSAAGLFVFPSLYEGFGLPPLEAMACGCPVVASGAGSLPEVLGDAALTVDPDDAGSIADGMERALTDSGLRADLSRRGREQAGRFSWRATAQAVFRIYDEALAI